jgi:hypothetical protein
MAIPSRKKGLGGGKKQTAPGGGKKKKPKKTNAKRVDAFGDTAEPVDDPTRKKKSRKSKKSERSAGGFIVAAAACVVTLAWAVVGNVQRAKKSARVLQSMRSKPLHVTEHASCRMDCRFITKKEVLQSLFQGRVNTRKSNPDEKPCPKYVVDAEITTPEGRRKTIQNVFSACPAETRLITTIDTSTNWPCGPC